jgi:NAD(P)-dependent dehydrogenase (short-subunit alcohol dehydrogenase family)
MGEGTDFHPDRDIPDLAGKVIFVTGGSLFPIYTYNSLVRRENTNIRPANIGTAGLGAETVKQFTKHNPAQIYFSGRDATKAANMIAEMAKISASVKATFVKMDLESLSDIKSALISQNVTRLDILVCNAGIMAVPPGLTKDGYEVQFGTNFISHALIIKLLLPAMLETAKEGNADVRIVHLTSLGAFLHPKGGIIFKDVKTTQAYGFGASWTRYGQSKVASILYAQEFARKYPQITSVVVHPGTIYTNLTGRLSFGHRMLVRVTNLGRMKTLEEGSYNTLWAATAKGVTNGAYHEPVGKPGRTDSTTTNQKLQEQLWEWTDQELTVY